MTVPYRAILLKRKARAVELNHEYFRDGVKYCEAAEIKANMPTLFDMEKERHCDVDKTAERV